MIEQCAILIRELPERGLHLLELALQLAETRILAVVRRVGDGADAERAGCQHGQQRPASTLRRGVWSVVHRRLPRSRQIHGATERPAGTAWAPGRPRGCWGRSRR